MSSLKPLGVSVKITLEKALKSIRFAGQTVIHKPDKLDLSNLKTCKEIIAF